MVRFNYPTKGDFRIFIDIIQSDQYPISRFLPPISEDWFETISNCVLYVEQTAAYEEHRTLQEVCARVLYKVAKRHELGDGNKRSAVMAVFLFCLLNDYMILQPEIIKQQAKRAASSKGRANEELMRRRISVVLAGVIKPRLPQNPLTSSADQNNHPGTEAAV